MIEKPATVELRVRYAETDQMGVVYHSNYLIWCEIGRTEFIRAVGLDYASMERAGVSLAVSEALLRFHASARYDEMIRIETKLTELRSRALTFAYLISNAETGTRYASASTKLIALAPDGRPVTLPADVRAALSAE
jgi:acyl-CoA thioester hydrolase